MTKSKAKTINSDNTAKTTKLAVTAMLAALSAVLMFFEFPLLHSMSSIFPKFPFLSEHSAWGRLPVQ